MALHSSASTSTLRIQVTFEHFDDSSEHDDIKAGQRVLLQRVGDALVCSTTDGRQLGSVPKGQAAQLDRSGLEGTIRTVRRAGGGDGSSGGISVVEVRFAPVDPARRAAEAARAAAAAHQSEQVVEEGSWRLSHEQLEALAESEELRWMLRDERLQGVVAGIDTAPDREQVGLRTYQWAELGGIPFCLLAASRQLTRRVVYPFCRHSSVRCRPQTSRNLQTRCYMCFPPRYQSDGSDEVQRKLQRERWES